MKLDINTGWKNITALVVAGLGGALTLATQIEGMDLAWAPDWLAPLAVIVGLVAAYLTGNIPDQDGDGDVDMDDHRIAAEKALDAMRSMKGAALLILPAFALLGCGSASQTQLVDARGEYWQMQSTFTGSAEASCVEDQPCESSLDAPGEVRMRAGADLCFWNAAFCTPVTGTATGALLVEDRGDGVQTYGSGVICVASPALGVVDKALLLAGLRFEALRVLGEWIDGDALCVSGQHVEVEP